MSTQKMGQLISVLPSARGGLNFQALRQFRIGYETQWT